jgi:hypothetical protein
MLRRFIPIRYSIFPISNFRSFDTYLFVSDRILPTATVSGADRQWTTMQVQDSSSSTRGRRHLWTLLRSLRQKNFTLEDIVNEFSAGDPKTIEAELKDIYEWI